VTHVRKLNGKQWSQTLGAVNVELEYPPASHPVRATLMLVIAMPAIKTYIDSLLIYFSDFNCVQRVVRMLSMTSCLLYATKEQHEVL